MIEIRDYELWEPPAYWKDGRFYLRSVGRSRVRVYTPECYDIPVWAFDKPGCPVAKPQIVCIHCGKVNTTLVSGKYCNKCGMEAR